MDFKNYQKLAIKTLIRRKSETANELLARLVLGIAGEAGECAEKTKKWLRGDYSYLFSNFKKDIKKEIGDLLWYVGVVSNHLKLDLDKIAQENIEKLKSRQKRGKLQGEGDSR